ncbi:DUF485 domain-containing protein [Streptomyces sp. NPDC005876]|uniref:DUF485 domain-containing protein n=1 Tax=unclassified Streptomyces TaxID=2593676 RepID=UPI0033C0AEF4
MQSSNDRLRSDQGGPGSARRHRVGQGLAPAQPPASPGYDDPWYDALASGWGEAAGGRAVPVQSGGRPAADDGVRASADVYLEVQRSAAFQEVRSRYRRFVVPATTGFFAWYVAYVVAATTAPELMARPVAGAVNVAMLAGLGQFLTTFLLTWAYARHARLRRDRAALDLRWKTQELTRTRGGAP